MNATQNTGRPVLKPVYDPATGNLTINIPARIMRQAAKAEQKTTPEAVSDKTVRERNGPKLDIIKRLMKKMPQSATVADIANKAHEIAPDVSVPNFRYLVNKLRKPATN